MTVMVVMRLLYVMTINSLFNKERKRMVGRLSYFSNIYRPIGYYSLLTIVIIIIIIIWFKVYNTPYYNNCNIILIMCIYNVYIYINTRVYYLCILTHMMSSSACSMVSCVFVKIIILSWYELNYSMLDIIIVNVLG